MTDRAEQQRARMIEHLRRISDVLAPTPIGGRYWVFGGLLIGWAREGDVLLHDSIDADFCYLGEDAGRLEASFPALEEAGFAPLHRFPGQHGEATEWSFEREGAKVEFFRIDVDGDKFRYKSFGHVRGTGEPVENTVEIPAQPLDEFSFLGRTWLKVRDHDAELTALYGDWRTPDPGWDYMHGPAIVARAPWDPSSYQLRVAC